jgi:mannose-6-phosphate isomerase-like protein (cupin superfamily)
MATAIVKSLDRPDERRAPSERGELELVTLEDVKPVASSELCEVTHTGYVVSGHQGVRIADGTEVELGPGDAFVIGPGHDAWVIGDEPCVTLDFSGSAQFMAITAGERSQR